MNRSKSFRRWFVVALPVFLAGFVAAHAAQNPDIDLSTCQATQPLPITYTVSPMLAPPTSFVAASGSATTINWTFAPLSATSGCVNIVSGEECAAVPPGSDYRLVASTLPGKSVPAATPVQIAASGAVTSADSGAQGTFRATVNFPGPFFANSCHRDYTLKVASTGGGWGDPHLTTVDGTHYDFQSAGEFTALRGDGFEVQTRQTPVSTSFIPGASAYSGIQSCVAVYTAVATRIASNRVTLEPRIDGVADPSGMELRVNGQLVKLTADGIDLYGPASDDKQATRRLEGHIAMGADNGIEIVDTTGTQLVVGPAYWPAQQLWYLNVNVFQTTATQGTMGRLANGSWLPALPDGSSLGSMPESEPQRYSDLFGRFANAWRVNSESSLFDYAPGSGTATYTVRDWPRNNPQSCTVAGRPVADPVPRPVAEQACGRVMDATHRTDCVFDVAATGNTQIAQSYEAMERVRPNGPGWQDPEPGAKPSNSHSGKWWWLLLLLLIAAAASL